MRRLSVLTLLVIPSLALAQGDGGDPDDKLSNDQPTRPLQMPPASSEARDAFDDFERFARRGAWERATKALYSIADDQARRFVDGRDGFIITVARKRRDLLIGLSPEGQAAYRLFYDAEAKKLLDEAEGSAEQEKLERIVSSYFPTSVGDKAADRLGDLYFEQGRFDRAADCWLAVLRERTEGEISPGLMGIKAALALVRAGRRSEAEGVRSDVAPRHGDDAVTLGGRKAKVSEHLKAILGESKASSPARNASAEGTPPDLAPTVAPAWQVRIADSVMAGMTPAEEAQWESNPLGAAVPDVAVEESRLYVNYLGHVFAVDLETGKMLWRSASYHNIDVPAMADQARAISPSRFAIVAAPGLVVSLSRDLREMNYQAPFRLTCYRAEGGEVLWKSADLPEYNEVEFAGRPILGGGTLFVAAKTPMMQQQNQPQTYLLAIRPHDGKLLWKTEVGVSRQGQRYFYYGMGDTTPQPRLSYRRGAVFVDTHAGVLARVDAETGAVDWGFAYRTEPVENMFRFFFFFSGNSNDDEPSTAPGDPFEAGEALLVKGAKGERLAAIDPDRLKLVWDRPIAKSARVVGADDERIYLAGPDLGALDRKTRALQWSARLPGGSGEARILARTDGLWQLTPRGIFELDPATGRVRRIFRGEDRGSSGGDLHLAGPRLLAVSDRTISAYPRTTAKAKVAVGRGNATSKSYSARATDD